MWGIDGRRSIIIRTRFSVIHRAFFLVDPNMPDDTIPLTIDGHPVRVPSGTSVAAAVLIARGSAFRRSVTGQLRGPLCGMGICYECRLTIDGLPQRTSCQTPCRAGMEVVTDVP
jgi:D-hydroxyproline dehydrogenase subunit gamma